MAASKDEAVQGVTGVSSIPIPLVSHSPPCSVPAHEIPSVHSIYPYPLFEPVDQVFDVSSLRLMNGRFRSILVILRGLQLHKNGQLEFGVSFSNVCCLAELKKFILCLLLSRALITIQLKQQS